MNQNRMMMDLTDPIYLDYNATTPLDPRVADAMEPFLRTHFGNPSSSHAYGIITRKAINIARLQVAALSGCQPENILFTSGGTESNNHALRGYAFANRHKGNHLITTVIEHPAVLKVFEYLGRQGFEISIVPVDEFGLVDPQTIEKSIRKDTILISVMHANNEVGTIQPIRAIAEICHRHDIVLHCDAAQSAGKIPIDVQELDVDLLSLAGHKFYAPKGVGALYIKGGIELEKFMPGGGQEAERRAGTENVMGIVGLGKAAQIAAENLEFEAKHNVFLRNLLQSELLAAFPGARINGHPHLRLPNTLNISFPQAGEFELMEVFSEIAASAGAACHAQNITISPVLSAMNVPPELAAGTIRFSTGRFTTERDILNAVKIIRRILLKQK